MPKFLKKKSCRTRFHSFLFFLVIHAHMQKGEVRGGIITYPGSKKKKPEAILLVGFLCCSILSLLPNLPVSPPLLSLFVSREKRRERTNDVTTERRARHTAPASITERVWLIRFFCVGSIVVYLYRSHRWLSRQSNIDRCPAQQQQQLRQKN